MKCMSVGMSIVATSPWLMGVAIVYEHVYIIAYPFVAELISANHEVPDRIPHAQQR